jgi:ABC-2 type transport system ATP-binding protein
MRSDLAGALLHDPPLLFLDEPTIGLDVVAKERIRQFIKSINRERDTTVILTTHDLGDVTKLCERVIMINEGRLVFDGPLADLRERFGGGRVVVVDFESEPGLIDVPGVQVIAREANRAWLRVERGDGVVAEVIATLFRYHRVRDLSIEETEIEEIVRKVYEELK